MSSHSSIARSPTEPPPAKRAKRPNKLFRACVQCVAAKTRCEDVIAQGCSVCRRKRKECSLAGAIVDECETGEEHGGHAFGNAAGHSGDFHDAQLGRQGARNGDGDRGHESARASLAPPVVPSVMYPALHPIRPSSASAGYTARDTSMQPGYWNTSTDGHVAVPPVSTGPSMVNHHLPDEGWQERLAESEARIRQLEDRVSNLQSLALSQSSLTTASFTSTARPSVAQMDSGPGTALSQLASTAVSPFTSHSPANALSLAGRQPAEQLVHAQEPVRSAGQSTALGQSGGFKDNTAHGSDPHKPLRTPLIANTYSRYMYSSTDGWLMSALNPTSFCLVTRGYITSDEVEVAWSAFQQAISTRLPLSIFSSTPHSGIQFDSSDPTTGPGAGARGSAIADLPSAPAEHPYMVLAMLHHVSPYNRRGMEGYSLVQAAEELVSAALKPLSRLKGDVTIEVIAALLVLALAPTLPDVVGDSSQTAAGMPDPATHPEENTDDHGNRRGEAGQHGAGTITRPPPAKYAAMALQLGRDSGLQAEVESMIRAAGDDLAEPQWREAYLKVELWMAVVSVYNLLQVMQSHRTPILPSILPLLPKSVRQLNPEMHDITQARDDVVRLGSQCLSILDRIEYEQPAEGDAMALLQTWRHLFDEFVEKNGSNGGARAKLVPSIRLDRDCIAQAIIVRLAMLIQHLPSPLAPLRSCMMSQMVLVRTCANTTFRHVVPDDQLAAIKGHLAAKAKAKASAKAGDSFAMQDGGSQPTTGKESTLPAHAKARASPLLKMPAYVAQCALLGYMTMQGTVAYMRRMAALARQHRQHQQRAQRGAERQQDGGAILEEGSNRSVDGHDETRSTMTAQTTTDDASRAVGVATDPATEIGPKPPPPSAVGHGSAHEIEAEIASVMDMVRFDTVAQRLRELSDVYGVILDSLDAMHGSSPERDRDGVDEQASVASLRATAPAPEDSDGTGQRERQHAPAERQGQARLGNHFNSSAHNQAIPSHHTVDPARGPMMTGGSDPNIGVAGSGLSYPHTYANGGTNGGVSVYQSQNQHFAPLQLHYPQTYQQNPLAFDPGLTMGGLFDADLFGWDLFNLGADWNVPFPGN